MSVFKQLRHSLAWLPIPILIGLTDVGIAEGLAIEEVIVVAQKRSQPIQKIPASVTAISNLDIVHSGIRDIFDLAEQIPALDVFQNAGPINTSFRIRRIGNEANIPNFEPAVGLFVDGAFRTRSGVGVGDLLDIERVEVLRGPQSSLYGKSTTAGLVSIITKRPTHEFEAFGEISAGRVEGAETVGSIATKLAVSGPLSESTSARLSGSFSDHDHTMRNLFGNDNSQDMTRYSLRTQFLYSPDQELEVLLSLDQFVIDSANTGDADIDEGVMLAAINTSFGVPCPTNANNDRLFCSNRAGVVNLDARSATLNIVFDNGGYKITSISAYEGYEMLRSFDADQLNIELLDIVDRQDSASYSQELRIASPIEKSTEWMGGAYFYQNDFGRGDPVWPTAILGPAAPLIELMPGVPFGQPGDSGILTSDTDSKHFSVFGEVVWNVSERFKLTASARLLSEEKQSIIVNTANHSTPTLITVGLAPPSASASLSRDTDALTWNVSGQYQWSDEVMAYAVIAKGFKSGGFNAGFGNAPAASREFGDEEVVSYEVGLKTMLLDRHLRLNASIFSAEYDDFQSAGFVGLRFLVNNAEKVDVSGVELDLQTLFSDRLFGGLSVSYVDAKYGLYTGGACHTGRTPDNADNTACLLTGSALPLAPRLKAAANVSVEQPTPIGELYSRLDWSWTDRYHTNATLDPRHLQSSYSLLNLRAGLRFKNTDLSIWVRNAGDETFVMQDGPTNLFARDPAFARFLGEPRSYGVTVRAQW